MAETDRPAVVVDAGPLIHLHELDCLDLLADFPQVWVSPVVWREAQQHQSKLTAALVPGLRLEHARRPLPAEWAVLVEAVGLDAGEISALQLLHEQRAGLFLCDDAAARLVAAP
jgi:predicted nucleic acid-binding protein